MSLLMQALKKAEQAKQQTDESGNNAPAETKHAPVPPESLSLSPMESEPTTPPPAVAKPDDNSLTFTPTEAVKDAPASIPLPAGDLLIPPLADLPAHVPAAPVETPPVMVASAPAAEPPAMQTNTAAEASATSRTAPPSAPQQTAARQPPATPEVRPPPNIPTAQQTAKTVFASKTPRKSRLPIAIFGLIVVVAASAGFGYFYIQNLTQKSSVLVAGATPQPLPAAMPEPAVPAQPADPVPPPSPVATPAGAPPDNVLAGKLAGSQAAMQKDPIAETKNVPISGKTATPETEQKTTAAQPIVKPAAVNNHGITIRQTSNVDHVNPGLASAYQSFIAGDIASAQQKYQQVLQHDASNRDALLGLAAIAIGRKQAAQAASLYLKVLELDPADADAIAGLTSLQQGNLAQNESRLKKILAENPNALAVQFVLGNLYAQQSRWAEAQQAYFQAFGGAPGNADYAFNLAVSLDRLSQTRLSLEYYQRALVLAQNGPGNFNKSAVQHRIRELQSSADN